MVLRSLLKEPLQLLSSLRAAFRRARIGRVSGDSAGRQTRIPSDQIGFKTDSTKRFARTYVREVDFSGARSFDETPQRPVSSGPRARRRRTEDYTVTPRSNGNIGGGNPFGSRYNVTRNVVIIMPTTRGRPS